MFKFAYILWSGTLQRSVVLIKTITGKLEGGEEVTVKWKEQNFEATILKLNNKCEMLDNTYATQNVCRL